jgi:Na+/proline symporter
MKDDKSKSAVSLPSGNPSSQWPKYTDSKFSEKHLDNYTKKRRSSPWFLTAANVMKMYLGIAFISVPKSISEAGLYGAIIGFVYIIMMNIFCVYILLKARNRFKRE